MCSSPTLPALQSNFKSLERQNPHMIDHEPIFTNPSGPCKVNFTIVVQCLGLLLPKQVNS